MPRACPALSTGWPGIAVLPGLAHHIILYQPIVRVPLKLNNQRRLLSPLRDNALPMWEETALRKCKCISLLFLNVLSTNDKTKTLPCKKIGVIKTAILSNLCQSFGVFFRSKNGVHAKFYPKKSLRRSMCSFIVLITLTKINIIYENCIHRNFSCDYLMPTRESVHCVGWLSVNIFLGLY